MADPTRVLVVDDDPMQLELVKRSLALEGFVVETAEGPEHLGAALETFLPHVVLLDVNVPGVTSSSMVDRVRQGASADTRIVLFSSWEDSKLRRLSIETKAHGWLSKSSSGLELARRLKEMVGA
jgi:DNA-binding response OmpR family regulator